MEITKTDKTIFFVVSIVVIILAITSYVIIKSQENFLLRLIKQDAIQYSDTVRRSLKHSMLENKSEDVKWIIDNIGKDKQVAEIRILNKEGRITVSSIKDKMGGLVDMQSEGCISCHRDSEKPSVQKEMTRIHKKKEERFIGIMQPIYNERECFKCHNESKKILGVLDVVLSLKEMDKEIYKNKRTMLLFFVITIFAISIVVLKSTYDLHTVNKQLEASYNKLKELDKVKSEFTRKVAHQLRSPISAIESCIRVVLDGYVSDDKKNEMLQRAETRTKSLLVMINDLLNLAKIEEMKVIQHKEPVDLNSLLHNIVSFMREKAEHKKIKLEMKVEAVLPTILADNSELEEGFSNIIDNAIKYTPEGGNVEVSGVLDNIKKIISIKIKDTGVGIPRDDINSIFDEFYRSENAKIYEKEGTGLGLTIAKKIFELYEGKITVESEILKGTTFTISFPA